jgi:hypothetical protein
VGVSAAGVIVDVDAVRENGLPTPRCVPLSSGSSVSAHGMISTSDITYSVSTSKTLSCLNEG